MSNSHSVATKVLLPISNWVITTTELSKWIIISNALQCGCHGSPLGTPTRPRQTNTIKPFIGPSENTVSIAALMDLSGSSRNYGILND
ncbi:patatin family protein [Sesbania bispinosa]|nr:patatin family protein [Sesbania bispinosa]